MRVTTTVCRLAVLASVVMATPMIATGQGRGNQWVQEATLTAPDGPAGDDGADVAIDGETVVVGASRAAVGGNTSQGAAFIHTRVFGTWIPTAQLTASGGAAGDEFGYSVAIANDTIVVGARYTDVNGKSDQGAAYVFTQTSGMWTQTAVLTAPNGAAGDYFGTAVAIDGNTIVVGAEWSAGCVGEPPCGGFRATGTAHVFTEADGVWTEAATLAASNGHSGGFFGKSVGIDGNTIVVGAWGTGGSGAAYVFTRTGSAWTETAELSGATDGFGWSVAIDGGTVVVGAPNFDTGALQNFVPPEGEVGTRLVSSVFFGPQAYVFTQTGCAWTETATLVAPSDWFAPAFGRS
ncbi:MAG: FG-GAP repeat protein, partial [Vicinamibacteraceae bacterium]